MFVGAFSLYSVDLLPIVFALAVVVSFAYLISNGALDWGPAKTMNRLNSVETGSTTTRTSSSTIRRIGAAAQSDAA